MQDPLPEIPWIVEPLLAQGERGLVYGEWGSYKSWLLMDLAIHLAAGQPWLNHFTIPTPRRVLYIDEEMSEIALRRRMKQLGLGTRLEETLQTSLPLQFVQQAGLEFTEPAKATQLLEDLLLHDFQPEVIILETFRRVFQGDENLAREVAKFWKAVHPLIQDGRALLLSHHMSKPSYTGTRNVRDRASGSTDIMAGADSAFALSLQKGTDRIVKVDHVKSRLGEASPPFSFTLEAPQDQQTARLLLMDQTAGSIPGREFCQQMLEDWLNERQGQTIRTKEVKAFLQQQQLSERSAEREWREYRDQHKLNKIKQGCYAVPIQQHPAA